MVFLSANKKYIREKNFLLSRYLPRQYYILIVSVSKWQSKSPSIRGHAGASGIRMMYNYRMHNIRHIGKSNSDKYILLARQAFYPATDLFYICMSRHKQIEFLNFLNQLMICSLNGSALSLRKCSIKAHTIDAQHVI